MTYTIRFLPEIVDDTIAGYQWYEAKSSGLGEEFLQVFFACTQEISDNPLLSPKIFGEFRRRLIRKFPFVLYYQIDRKTIVVFGLFHCARGPLFIQKQLNNRE
jgi:hypothetical protein